MWLINCRTLTLEEHLDFMSVDYAILSHTWEQGEEVQFDELRNKTARGKKGWQKIKKTCQLARDDGCDLAWVDTCCIDKKSSAELSEAINSMFPWYQWSKVCYAYLADYDSSRPDGDLSSSRWFSRGWTLQELIAPARVKFFEGHWKLIGEKTDLSRELSVITGIEEPIMRASGHDQLESALREVPVARKMSWASERETTRVEDMAYSLLGIFGINLPLLYGEGERAFIRLQEEIMKHSNDLSLLAWTASVLDRQPVRNLSYGVLARHVRYFRKSGTLALTKDSKKMPDFSSTNKGLRLETEALYHVRGNLHALDINCVDAIESGQPLGIYLEHQGQNVFARSSPDFLMPQFAPSNANGMSPTKTETIFLSKIDHFVEHDYFSVPYTSLFVPKPQLDPMLWHLSEIHPQELWQNANQRFQVDGLEDFVGYHAYSPRRAPPDKPFNHEWPVHERPFHVFFGFGYGFPRWTRVMNLEWNENIGREIKRHNWERVAQSANMGVSRRECIGITDDVSMLNHCIRKRRLAIMLRATVRFELVEGALNARVSLQTEFWRV